MSRVIKTAKIRDSRKKRSDNQNAESEPYLTPLTRLRQYKGIRSKRQKMEDDIVLNGDSHNEVEIIYEKVKKPIVETNGETEITIENCFQNGNDTNNTEVVVYDEIDDLNENNEEVKTDGKELDSTFESVDITTDVIEIILHDEDVQKEEIIENKSNEKLEPIKDPVTPEPIRKEKYVGHKMSGRRPLRGINSPHPSSKRKASYDENNDVKRICEDSPSTSSPGWRYFQSSLWKFKEAFTPSKETNLLSPNDSMTVNVDDTSIHHFEDSKFEAELQQPKSNWKVCNIM